MSTFEVRPYDAGDRDALVALFGAAGEGAPSSDVWGHEQSLAEVYLTPYLDLEPESVFVVVVEDRPSGYLAGCVDETAFPSEEERTRAAIQKYGLMKLPGPRAYFRRERRDLLVAKLRRQPVAGELADPRWPAHLHIDVLPVARGTGAAEQLMHAWFNRLLLLDSPGCYLQTSAENVRAVRYFERMGFAKHGPNPVVPGLRHEGRRMHQQTMVWSA